eukprot:6176977-Pleurochrysis_carterae.AAC.1
MGGELNEWAHVLAAAVKHERALAHGIAQVGARSVVHAHTLAYTRPRRTGGASGFEMVRDGARWCGRVRDGVRWCETVRDGARWCEMALDSAGWCEMVGARRRLGRHATRHEAGARPAGRRPRRPADEKQRSRSGSRLSSWQERRHAAATFEQRGGAVNQRGGAGARRAAEGRPLRNSHCHPSLRRARVCSAPQSVLAAERSIMLRMRDSERRCSELHWCAARCLPSRTRGPRRIASSPTRTRA